MLFPHIEIQQHDRHMIASPDRDSVAAVLSTLRYHTPAAARMALLTGPMLSGNQFQELLQHLTTNLKQVNTPTLTKEDNPFQIA